MAGTLNTALGYGAGPSSASAALTNATAIGALADVEQNNSLVLGSTANVGQCVGGCSSVNVGIGRPSHSSPSTWLNYRFSTGGFQFPDGSVQTTAASSSGGGGGGGGTITGVTAGTGPTGGGTSGTVSLALAANNCGTSGTALTELNPLTCTPFATLGANTFTGNQTVNGNETVSGNFRYSAPA